MTYNSINNLYSFPQPLTRIFPAPIFLQRAPTTADYIYNIGQEWLDLNTSTPYILVKVSAKSATWLAFNAGTSTVATLEGDSGGLISPLSGNITLSGTPNQISTTGLGSTITFSISSTLITPGSIASASSINAGTSITATLGDITATNGNFIFGTAGNHINIQSSFVGKSTGVEVLINGTTIVSQAGASITSSSLIFLTRLDAGSTNNNPIGNLTVGTITPGLDFVINAVSFTNSGSIVTTDKSIVGWFLVN